MKRRLFMSVIAAFTLSTGVATYSQTTPVSAPDPSPTVSPITKPAVLKIRRKDSEMSFSAALNNDEESELRTLVLNKGELVEFLDSDIVLHSSEPDSVQVLNGNILLARERYSSAKITATRKGIPFLFSGAPTFLVRVGRFETVNIDTKPEMLSYKEVRDRFGKGIASYYVVVQVSIVNNYSDKQFLVQDVSVLFDPAQCKQLHDYFRNIDPEHDGDVYEARFQPNKCMDDYGKYFNYPTTISPIDRETILAVGNAEKYRSRRYQLFQAMRFVADVGGGLAAFKLLGTDAITGFNFLGNGFFNAADAAIPKLAEQKLENLRNGVPPKVILIPSSDKMAVNIFIESDRVFNKNTWATYKLSAKAMDRENQFLSETLKLFLTSTATGVLIDNNAQKTTSFPGGGAESLVKESKRRL